MDKNKISVIVPVYNTAPYLETCIESICRQTYENIEILLINDGSTDNSGTLCDVLAQKDHRIRVIHQKNAGASIARNTGIDHATGSFYAFVDSDDIIADTMLEILYRLTVTYQAEIAMCTIEKIPVQARIRPDAQTTAIGVFCRRDALRNIITASGYGGYLCNKLFCAELFHTPAPLHLDPAISVCEDLLLTCQLTDRAERIAYTSQPLYGYVDRAGSALSTVTSKTLSSLTAKEVLIGIYDRNDLPDARSWYAYSLANMLTFCHVPAIREHFCELASRLKIFRRFYRAELHTARESLLFYPVAFCPRLFSLFYSSLRKFRSVLCAKIH